MSERQNIEWKKSWNDEYLKWICGFANAQGGKIFIGKDDKGSIIGVKNHKKLMEDIPNKIQNHLGIMCDVNLHKEENKHYIEIVVKPYDVPISYRGKYYYRSGSTKQELRGTALNKFLLKKTGRTWDDVIEPRADINDIDKMAVENFKSKAVESKRLPFIKKEKDIKRILDNLSLLENSKLKRSALLLFGKNPVKYYINAYVKIGRFGETDDDLKFQEVVKGNIFELADKTLELLDKKFFVAPVSYEGLHRNEKWEYPYKAVRETLINAIVHRDYTGAPIQISVYDDKIMIWNEGQLPPGMSIEDLKHKHSSRPHNPIIADVFFKGGLIEAWGRGTLNIFNECKKVGLPEPEFKVMSGGIAVILFKDIYNKENLEKMGLSNRQVKAVLYVKEKGKIKNKDYRELTNISDETARIDLKKLINKGVFVSKGKGRGAHYTLRKNGD